MLYSIMRFLKIVFLLLTFFSFTSLQAQRLQTPDTTIIFTPSNPNLVRTENYRPFTQAWGLDILTSNNGFGFGTFYRYEIDEELSFIASFAISDVKDEAEFEQYDYYTGQNFVPGKINRLLLLPLHACVQYRLFKDDIVDNFRPYVTAGLGPTMVFVAPYATYTTAYFGNLSYTEAQKIDFFTSLKYGKLRYTVGGFVGAGVNFGMEKGTLTSLSVRYLIAPFANGIEVMRGGYIKNFGGLFIYLTFGSMF